MIICTIFYFVVVTLGIMAKHARNLIFGEQDSSCWVSSWLLEQLDLSLVQRNQSKIIQLMLYISFSAYVLFIFLCLVLEEMSIFNIKVEVLFLMSLLLALQRVLIKYKHAHFNTIYLFFTTNLKTALFMMKFISS